MTRLVRRYQQPLAAYLWALGAPRATLEPLLIETFVTAHRRLGQRAEAASVRAWLFGIATRLVQRDGLAPPDRCLLVLCCLEGFTYAEVAEMMGLSSPAAVRARVRRAKAVFNNSKS